jgi:hypothetical protein
LLTLFLAPSLTPSTTPQCRQRPDATPILDHFVEAATAAAIEAGTQLTAGKAAARTEARHIIITKLSIARVQHAPSDDRFALSVSFTFGAIPHDITRVIHSNTALRRALHHRLVPTEAVAADRERLSDQILQALCEALGDSSAVDVKVDVRDRSGQAFAEAGLPDAGQYAQKGQAEGQAR